jgi:hypothetical protein
MKKSKGLEENVKCEVMQGCIKKKNGENEKRREKKEG